MSNTSDSAADSLSTASPAPAPTPPTEPAAGDPLADLPADQSLFPRGYVEKLRGEAQRYRNEAQQAAQRAAEYEQVYGRYEPEDRQAWMRLAQTWETDPQAGAEMMRDAGLAALADMGVVDDAASAEEAVEQAEAGDLTAEAVQQMIAEAMMGRDEQMAQERGVEAVYAQMRDVGYDPESKEGLMLLWTINNETDGDFAAGVEKMKQDKQAIIDEYVAGRTGTARPTSAPNGGVAANGAVEIQSWDEARKATETFLRSQRLAGP